MYDTWINYSKELTTVGVRLINDPKMGPFLPCFTVCPWTAFRKHGFYYSRKDYESNTFNFSEIVYQK